MKLISADKILRHIKTKINPYGKPFEGTAYEFGLELMKYIDNIQTEYDVDKVVEELQESASRHTKKYTTPYGDKGYKDVKAISVNKAIEIVKAGAKE